MRDGFREWAKAPGLKPGGGQAFSPPLEQPPQVTGTGHSDTIAFTFYASLLVSIMLF